jgi:hypothetical protein
MSEAAMQMVQQDFEKVLQRSDDIPRLSPEFLKSILAYEYSLVDEIDRFCFIQMWCCGGSHDSSAKDNNAVVAEKGDNESTNGISSSKEAGDRIIDPPAKGQKQAKTMRLSRWKNEEKLRVA